MDFPKLLGLRPGVTAVIGSGGKTSLLRRLAEELPGTVLLCTTTHIRPFEEYPLLTAPTQGSDRSSGSLSGDPLRKWQADRSLPFRRDAGHAGGLCAGGGRRFPAAAFEGP